MDKQKLIDKMIEIIQKDTSGLLTTTEEMLAVEMLIVLKHS